MPSIQVIGQLVDPTTNVEGSADIRIASLINHGQTTKKSISHESTDASGNYDFQLVYGKHLIFVKYEDERIYIPIGYAVVGDSTPDPIDLIQLINLSDENPPNELVTELQQLRENTLNDIVDTSAQVLENAGYKGLWPDTGGSALKGETWQTQVGGVQTGQYYTALQNTSSDPNNDNVNWKAKVSKENIKASEERGLGLGVSLYQGTGTLNGEKYVQNGDIVPAGTTHLSVLINGKPEDVAILPIASGVVSLLTETSATLGGTAVKLTQTKTIEFYNDSNNSAVDNMIAEFTYNPLSYAIGTVISTGSIRWEYKDSTGPITEDNFRIFNVANVRDYGAKLNGIDDDSIILQRVIDNNAETYIPIGFARITSTLNIPAGKILHGAGLGANPLAAPTDTATVLRYEGTGVAVSINGSTSKISDLVIWDAIGTASEGLLINGDGNMIESSIADNILVYGVVAGTGFRLKAFNSGAIAYCKFNVRVRNALNGYRIDAPGGAAGFVNSNQFYGGAVSGAVGDRALWIQGGNDNKFHGTVLETQKYSIAGIDVESGSIDFNGRLEGTATNEDIPLVRCAVGTQGSNIGGLGGDGLILDLGFNNITFRSAKTPQPINSSDNLFKNAGFNAVNNNTVKGWTISGAGVILSSTPSVIVEGAQDLSISVPAGVNAELSQTFDTSIYGGNPFIMGGYVRSTLPDLVAFAMTDGTSVTSGSKHLGDGQTYWLGHSKDTVSTPSILKAFLSINNSAGVSDTTVFLTMPTIVTGFQLPIPSAKKLDQNNAEMTGLLSESFGTSSVSASLLVLSRDGNKFVISGTDTITRINDQASDRFPTGATITLFADAAGMSISDGGAYILLNGTFTAASKWDNITLTHVGSGVWVETSRTLV